MDVSHSLQDPVPEFNCYHSEKFLHTLNWIFLCCSLGPLPHILPLCASERSLALFHLHPASSHLQTTIRSLLAFSSKGWKNTFLSPVPHISSRWIQLTPFNVSFPTKGRYAEHSLLFYCQKNTPRQDNALTSLSNCFLCSFVKTGCTPTYLLMWVKPIF